MKKFIWFLIVAITIPAGSFSYGAEGTKPLPGIPKKKELQKRSLQPVERPKLRTQPRSEVGWADAFLPEYTRNVLDPEDGLRAGDGRVAVLQGWEAMIIYEFASGEEAVNGQGADLTIYTSASRRFAGPYNVYVANYGSPDWVLIGREIIGTTSFRFPSNLPSAQLVLLINQHGGETEIDGVQALYPGGSGGDGGGDIFDYYPDELVGLRADRIDTRAVEAARTLLRGTGNGYQMSSRGEIEVRWNQPTSNVPRANDLIVNAEGSYQVWVTDRRGQEIYLGPGSGTRQFDLPGYVSGIIRARIVSDGQRPATIYAIAGRR